MPDELFDLFANLPKDVLADFSGGSTPPPADDGLRERPDHGGVTDADIQAFVDKRFQPLRPRFEAGKGGAAPQGGLEDGPAGAGGSAEPIPGRMEPPASSTSTEQPEPGSTSTESQGEPSPAAGDAGGEGGTSPVPPSPTADTPPPPEPTPPSQLPDELIFGEGDAQIRLPRSKAEALAQFSTILDGDPNLRQLVADYLAGQTVNVQPYAGYPPVPVPPVPGQQQQPPMPVAPQPLATPQPFSAPATSGAPQLPNLMEDDLADPAIRALYETVQAQNQYLANMQQQQFAAQQQQAQRIQAEQAAIVNRVTASYKSQKELTDEEMDRVQTVATNLQVLPSLLRGIDPITGAPSRPDPLTAIERAYDIAFSQIPELRDREVAKFREQLNADNTRKRKASAVSGNSGSVPRTTPAPTTAQGRTKALHEEVAAMFAGNWTPPEG